MTTDNIKARLSASLDISTLLPMQTEMGKIRLPAKVLLCAPTGSGKTVAFIIALLRSLKAPGNGIQAAIIAPTRELALQIFEVVRPLAAPEYKSVALYGGHSFESESRSLEGAPDIVVGTPGRMLDHIRRGRLSLYDVRAFVIDEYDKALELGFHEEMKALAGRMRKADTMILTSATKGEIPDFIGSVERTLDYSSCGLAAKPEIDIFEVTSPTADKLETLAALLKQLPPGRQIVFLNHRDAAERVYTYLNKLGFPVVLYHGGLEQQLRQRAIILFNNGSRPILISTDLASRGLDICDVRAVIHYHLPGSEETWTHRNGRTARMEAEGSAYVIVSEHDKRLPFMDDLPLFTPSGEGSIPQAATATLYINAGKKEKISKGDIAGYIINKGGLTASEVGRIDVLDHCSYVAVPADKSRQTVVALAPHKLKNTRVRVTQLKAED